MGMDYRSLWICSPYVTEVMPICYVPSDVLEEGRAINGLQFLLSYTK